MRKINDKFYAGMNYNLKSNVLARTPFSHSNYDNREFVFYKVEYKPVHKVCCQHFRICAVADEQGSVVDIVH